MYNTRQTAVGHSQLYIPSLINKCLGIKSRLLYYDYCNFRILEKTEVDSGLRKVIFKIACVYKVQLLGFLLTLVAVNLRYTTHIGRN